MSEKDTPTIIVSSSSESINSCGQVASMSVIGSRSVQQDAIAVETMPDGLLAMICDGMGGMEGGEKAIEIAVRILRDSFRLKTEQEPITDFFMRMSKTMDQAVTEIEENGRRLRAGTTVIAVISKGRQLYWMSIGDSRLYIKRGGEMLCPVKSHNYREYLNNLLLSQRITEEIYGREILKGEALTAYLGMGEIRQMEVNLYPFIMEPGDQILLCSDGLYRSISDHQIEMVLDREEDISWKVSCLIDMAVTAGGNRQDNTSIILYQYAGTINI